MAPASISTCPSPTRPATTWRSSPGTGSRQGVGGTCARSAHPMTSQSIRATLRRGVIATLLGLAGGCATMGAPAAWYPGNLQPLIIGWQQFFRIQWTATPKGASTLIDGYITNTWG